MIMSTVTLRTAEQGSFIIEFHGNLDKRGSRGYSTEAVFKEDVESGNWTASMNICDMTPQESPEAAGDRLSQYLLAMSKAVKGRNIKHLKMSTMFDGVSK